MLYLYCLVWLRSISHLATLRSQIQDNNKFCQKLLLYLEHVIKCSTYQNPHPKILHLACLDTNDSITTSQFVDLLRSDSKNVAYKVQIHSSLYNPICYKYSTYNSKLCRFDFLWPLLLRSQIDSNRTI